MEQVVEKDKTSELAEQKLEQMTADEKAKEESKDASLDNSSTKKEKIEGSEDDGKAEETESEMREDIIILEIKDEELNEAELVRKNELIQEKEDAKTPEEKQKDWQDNVQKRIDELSGEVKAEKEGRKQDADYIKTLEKTISDLKGDLENSGSIESESVKNEKTDEGLYMKMVDEDENLPREKRREMSENELEEFLLENYTKANEWIVRRELRRDKIRTERKNSRQAAENINSKAKQFFAEYPGCNAGFAKQKELISQGKTEQEAIEIISADNKDFALMMELFKEDKKYSDPNTGPELMSVEMKKRKSGKESKETFTKEEVDQMKKEAIEAEQQRVASIDQGITSSVANTISDSTPEYKEGLRVFIAAGKRKGMAWTDKDYKEILKYGRDARRA